MTMTNQSPILPFTARRLPRSASSSASIYVSDDENASGSEAGDSEEDIPRQIEQIDLDGPDTPEQIDLTGDDFVETYIAPSIDFASHASVGSARTDLGEGIRPGDCVECLHENAAFLRIVKITRDHRETFLHGDLLQRNGEVDERFPEHDEYDEHGSRRPLPALLPRTKNEVCAILKISDAAGAAATSLGGELATRHISNVGLVRNVIFTNKHHEELNGHHLGEFYSSRNNSSMENAIRKENEGSLFCRRKYIEKTDSQKREREYVICSLSESECSPDCANSTEQTLSNYRAPTSSFQSPSKRKREVIDISSDNDDISVDNSKMPVSKKQAFRDSTETVEFTDEEGNKETLSFEVISGQPTDKKYVYADLCTGAGGTATGARMAGFMVQYLLDFDKDSCKTLNLNFPGVACLHMDISAFSQDDTSRQTGGDQVDVMHISFPCQGHSTANRGMNEELDMERIATAYGTLEAILEKVKPRVLTLEQVPGILYKRDGRHFRAQISSLTSAGYSLRWKVVNFAQYGNSHARKRVIVIAACPGQILPLFPTPTHGPGLVPFVTVADILAEVPILPRNDPLAYAIPRNPRILLPWNPNIPLRACVTGSGGKGNWHPSGTRDFTYQEKSQLQGFHHGHKYYAQTKKSLGRQIGNAVPPVFANALFQAIIPCLVEMDKKMSIWYLAEAKRRASEAAALEKRNAEAAQNPIVLD